MVALICVRFVLARVAWRYLPSRRRAARANRLPVFYSPRYFRRRTPSSRRLARPDMDGKHVVWPLRESVRRLACLRCRLASRSCPSSNQMEASLSIAVGSLHHSVRHGISILEHTENTLHCTAKSNASLIS